MFKNFKNSAKNLKSTRALCTAAILSALFVVLYSIKLNLAPELRITFTFIPLALAGWLLGPVPAMLVGLIGDVIGCIIFPAGPYFPGFTLTKIVAGLIYGAFLYRTFPPKAPLYVSGAILCTNLFANVIMNSLWLSILYGKAWSVYAASHLVKNILASPIEIIILLILIKILSERGIKKMYK